MRLKNYKKTTEYSNIGCRGKVHSLSIIVTECQETCQIKELHPQLLHYCRQQIPENSAEHSTSIDPVL